MMIRPNSAGMFSLYCQDLVRCQRRQASEDGYVGICATTPFDAWLRCFGWRRWEGNLKRAWHILMYDLLESDTSKMLDRLLELWDVRRGLWMQLGGYLVKKDGHRRGAFSAPVHKRTSPPPWRLSSSQSRRLANARKPNTMKLNAEIDEAYTELNSALEAQNVYCKLPIMILALAGSIQSGASTQSIQGG